MRVLIQKRQILSALRSESIATLPEILLQIIKSANLFNLDTPPQQHKKEKKENDLDALRRHPPIPAIYIDAITLRPPTRPQSPVLC